MMTTQRIARSLSWVVAIVAFACGDASTGGGGATSSGATSSGGGAGGSEQVCTPGTEVFCMCAGGVGQGTKTCAEDGMSIGECLTPDGACPDISNTGPVGICIPDEVIACTCDNGDMGTNTCDSDGLTFSDCMTPAGVCGPGGTGTEPLYSPCGDADECVTGVCVHGFCTRSCADYTECYFETEELYGDCALTPTAGGPANTCVPYCLEQADCAAYGPGTVCSGAIALDDPDLGFAGCAAWGDEAHGMPYDTLCDANTGELFYLGQVVMAPCNLGLDGAQNVCSFDVCTKGCFEAIECPAMDCSSNGSVIGCCLSEPDCD